MAEAKEDLAPRKDFSREIGIITNVLKSRDIMGYETVIVSVSTIEAAAAAYSGGADVIIVSGQAVTRKQIDAA